MQETNSTETKTSERPPFTAGQAVQARIGDGSLIREGQWYRVTDVRPSSDCGSGWMVDVWYMRRGRIPQNITPLGSMDAECFFGVRR